MKKSICAVAAGVAMLGFATSGYAEPTAEEQTSAEQVQMCDDGLQACAGGDVNACVTALKTCVGDKRAEAIKLMEAS